MMYKKLHLQAEIDMFSLFKQKTTNLSYPFVMWNASRTAHEAPVRFQFMKSEKVDCFGKQLIQLKVSIATVFTHMILC